MKKILCFMLVIVVMASITIPAFAMDYNGYNLPDMPEYNTAIYKYAYLHDYAGSISLFVSDFDIYINGSNSYSKTAGSYYQYVFNNTKFEWQKVGEKNTILADTTLVNVSTAFPIFWSAKDVYNSDGTLYIAGSLICDGSTCPATDMNFDDICDSCGSPLAYNLRVTPKTYEFIIKHSDNLTLKYTYTETLAGTEMNAVYADDRVTVSFNNPVNHYQYKLVGDEWEEYASYPNTYGSHAMSLSETATILSSNLVVYDENGEVFFRNPLWMVTGQVVQGEMKNLTTETAGTMKVLVLCGVGLMALLVVLSLFGKRSLIFRK